MSGEASPRPAAGPRPVVASVDPEPDAGVLAAIVTAVEECWPRPAPVRPPGSTTSATAAWRFSGRWWAKPTTARRERPWTGVNR